MYLQSKLLQDLQRQDEVETNAGSHGAKEQNENCIDLSEVAVTYHWKSADRNFRRSKRSASIEPIESIEPIPDLYESKLAHKEAEMIE